MIGYTGLTNFFLVILYDIDHNKYVSVFVDLNMLYSLWCVKILL